MTRSLVNVEECLSAARAGSRDALGQALQACRPYLLEIARAEADAALRAKGGASDLVQETFLDAARAFPRFRGDSGAALRAWLRRLLLHRVAKHGRRFRSTRKRCVRRETPLESLAADGAGADPHTPSEGASADEQLQRLHRALERLPADYRRVVHLRYLEGQTFEQIGPLMGRSANAVRLLWLRAVERVKHDLRADADA
jgi:RNA polymerase sigma-70 factor (ECF subfamily)